MVMGILLLQILILIKLNYYPAVLQNHHSLQTHAETQHYQDIEDEVASVIAMSKEREMFETEGPFDMHLLPITEEEVIDALRLISPYKAQGHDNIHNAMLKNGGEALIKSLVFLFDWSFQIAHMP